MKPPQPPTDRSPSARDLAHEILHRVEGAGAFASVLLEHHESTLTDARERGLLHELVLGVLRRRSVLDHVVGTAASRPIEKIDLPVLIALRTGTYSLLFLDRVPDYAAVDASVRAVRRLGHASAAGFVNAVLRSIARADRAKLLPPDPVAGDVAALSVAHSHPEWWVDRLVNRIGWSAAAELLERNNRPAPVVLRASLTHGSRDELRDRLQQEGIETEPGAIAPHALRVSGGRTARSETLHAGFGWVQDEVSQIVPLLFGTDPVARVADLCAAPGTKTFQLAESLEPGGLLVALDRHRGRLRRMRRGLARFGIEAAHLIQADLSRSPLPVSGRFDRVLVDAPCSGTGTLRQHPEIRWRLAEEDLERIAGRQGKILDAAAALVAPGGALVYSVCSIEPEEGEEVVREFLGSHPGFAVVSPVDHLPDSAAGLVGEDGFLRTSIEPGGDGFFAARLDAR